MSGGSLLGKTVGHIRVVDLLGHGGMGEVYVGYDEKLKRKVALKAIRARHRMSQPVRERFLREAQILSALDHPNICKIYDFIESDDVDLLVLELVDGVGLAKAIEAGLEPRQRFDIAECLCRVLEIAHARGIAHRDLKPDNVLLTSDGVVKVLDFGLARSTFREMETVELVGAKEPAAVDPVVLTAAFKTTAGQIVGTVHYMSPEQAMGSPVTVATDLYSLGLVLQELFTGQRARADADGSTTLVEARIGKTLPVEGLGRDLTALIEELKSVDPEARPSARETRKRLDWIRRRPARRVRYLVAAGVVLLLMLAGLKYTVDLRRERDQAQLERDRAEQVVKFLQDIFRLTDPFEEGGESITAREILDQGAKRVEAELDSQPAVQARIKETIGNVYLNLGLYDRAESLLREALEIHEDLGEDTLAVAQSLDGLGLVLLQKGEFQNAEPLFMRSLELRTSLLGASHPQVAESLYHRALLQRETGDLALAKQLLQEAIHVQRRTAPESPVLGDQVADLAALLLQIGDHAAAAPLYREALELRRQAFGDRHPRVAASLNDLAVFQGVTGDHAAAEKLFQEALEINKQVLGERHIQVAQVLNNFGSLHYHKEQYDEAESRFQEALAITREWLGPVHPQVARRVHNLGVVQRESGKLKEAETSFREALRIKWQVYGSDHLQVGISLQGLGSVLTRTGDLVEAEESLREGLRLLDKALSSEHWRAGEARAHLGDCLARQASYAEAEQFLVDGYETLRDTLGSDNVRTRSALDRLVALYEAWEKEQTAATYRALAATSPNDDS